MLRIDLNFVLFFSSMQTFERISKESSKIDNEASAVKGKLSSQACFWSGALTDSHYSANCVSRKWSTHMDSRIHRAFPKKRYKDNKLYWQTRTAKAHKRRGAHSSPLSLSVFHPDDHLPTLPSFYVYVLPLLCNQFRFSVFARIFLKSQLTVFPQSAFSHYSVISLAFLSLSDPVPLI